MKKWSFSLLRLWAIMLKEFIQMRRDPLTFGILVAIPLMQLILFGYAINTNPKQLPTAVISSDHTPFTRALISGIKNTDYFKVVNQAKSEEQADDLLAKGDVQFIISIPSNFTRDLIRGQRPQLSVDADATDPVASGSALKAIPILIDQIFNPLLVGNLRYLRATPPPIDVVAHAKYNPEALTEYNIVPGLLGVVLTMTMILVTGLAITREHELGTMESLLATPAKSLEVMIGKILPYIIVGYIQVGLIIISALILFHVPLFGSLILLILATLPFISANLAIGISFSSIARNQLQAVQLTFFFFLPSILLSGFMFPFRGMPTWAQYLGNCLPLTHFVRIVRGIMLKGNDLMQIWPEMWPMLIFMLIVILIGAKMYRRTLD
ncbi:MAG: ABC transporter permease [Gammaproteobacteria bacterium]|nr:ABC transporter permease [Gammaproteobacteria bacterium]